MTPDRAATIHASNGDQTNQRETLFVQGQGWTAAGELQPGNLVSTATGEWLSIESVTDTHQSVTASDFRVSEYHTYFIAPADLAFDVWVHNTYRSSFAERLAQTPAGQYGDAAQAARGSWTGVRGRSTFIPANTPENAEIIALLEAKGLSGIKYRNGIPNFSAVAEGTINTTRMTISRADNYALADMLIANQLDITIGQANIWREQMQLTWHELNNTRTMQLIPTTINNFFGHLGGVSELKRI